MQGYVFPIFILLLQFKMTAFAADPKAAPPKFALFPLTGSADEETRDKYGFALRVKLDRTQTYDVIDGPKMQDLAAEAKEPINLATPVHSLRELAKLVDADVLAWGEVNATGGVQTIRVNLLDLRETDPHPHLVEKTVKDPTELRFVIEEILESLPGVAKFEHPSETSVIHDAESERLWQKNPNLVKNWDFSHPGAWTAIYMAERYEVKISDKPPEIDKVGILRIADSNTGTSNNVLAMNLSRNCAQSYGLAALSDPMEIVPDTRYRLSFRYKSDGPNLHVFVKGYTMGKDLAGNPTLRECYRRQVPPSQGTAGQWVTIIDDLNPQHVEHTVKYLRIDLYAYLSPGTVQFDDVILKAVGKQTHTAKDDAIKKSSP